MENLLDYFLDFVHLFLIFFNLFGWISKKTRVYNLICLLATLSCWFIVGLWYGIGYCPLTDYHWEVKTQLGHENLPPSYIKYLLDGIFSANFSSRFIEILTMLSTAISFILSVYLNIRDKFIKK